MSIVEDVKKIDAHYFSAYVLIFCAVVSPGILIIKLFSPAYFSALGVTKLLLLAASIALPLPIINTFIAAYSEGKEQVDLQDAMMLGCLLSVLCLYGAILGAYLFFLDFRSFIYMIFIIEFGILTWSFFLNRKNKKVA